MLPLVTLGVMVVAPTRASQVPADCARAKGAAKAMALAVRNFRECFMCCSPCVCADYSQPARTSSLVTNWASNLCAYGVGCTLSANM